MCGLIGIFSKNKTVNRKAVEIFEDQQNRGVKGFGAVFMEKRKIKSIRRACEPTLFIIDMLDKENSATGILAHHRQPTSSENRLSQTHPILVSNKELKFGYLIAHNGVLRNEDDLKEEHEKLGYKYTTLIQEERGSYLYEKFNDSESLAIEVARFIERKSKEIAAEGSYSFLVAQFDKKTKKIMNIFFGTNGSSPLKIKKSKGKEIILRSEGAGDDVEKDKLFHFSIGALNIHSRKINYREKKTTTTIIKNNIYNDSFGSYQSSSYFKNTSRPSENRSENHWNKIDKNNLPKKSAFTGTIENGRITFEKKKNEIGFNIEEEFNKEVERTNKEMFVSGEYPEDDECTNEDTFEGACIDELRESIDEIIDGLYTDMETNTEKIYNKKEIGKWKRIILENINIFFDNINMSRELLNREKTSSANKLEEKIKEEDVIEKEKENNEIKL